MKEAYVPRVISTMDGEAEIRQIEFNVAPSWGFETLEEARDYVRWYYPGHDYNIGLQPVPEPLHDAI